MKIANEERWVIDAIDLPGLNREQYEIAIGRVPTRVYAEFTADTLLSHRVRNYPSQDEQVYRVERLPKSLRGLHESIIFFYKVRRIHTDLLKMKILPMNM